MTFAENLPRANVAHHRARVPRPPDQRLAHLEILRRQTARAVKRQDFGFQTAYSCPQRKSSASAGSAAANSATLRARVGQIVRLVACSDRASDPPSDNDQIVIAVVEIRAFERHTVVEQPLLDAGVETRGALRLQARIIGERDFEARWRTDAGAARGVQARAVAPGRTRSRPWD